MGTKNGDGRTGVADHPLLLTVAVLYSIVLGLPLSEFPPIDAPGSTDLLVAHVFLLFLVRTALTFFYAERAADYPAPVFVLEVLIAVLFAWQFRVLLAQRQQDLAPLWLFYLLQLAVIGTMIVWSRLLKTQFRSPPPPWIHVIRVVGVITSCVGLALEHPAVNITVRIRGRWVVSALFLALTLTYAFSKPWRAFNRSARNP